MLLNFLKKSNTQFIKIKEVEYLSDWGGPGIVFYVKNGKGLLSTKYGYLEKQALLTLIFKDIPLIRFHNNSPYFCPTCEKIISAGYGLNMIDQDLLKEMRVSFNRKFLSLEQSFEDLKLLLGLLPTGYYALVDTELYPTNGNGDFFWTLSNARYYNKASCPIYDGEGLFSSTYPCYILPTQPPCHYNPEQAEYYRKNDEYRAVAYLLEDYLCALIDGHHKAVAAALDAKKVKTLVIIPADLAWESDKKNHIKAGISINGFKLHENEMVTPVHEVISFWKNNQLTNEDTNKYLIMINKDFDNFKWPQEILETSKHYPDVTTIASIEFAGGISNERLDKIIKNEEILNYNEALNIIIALRYLKSKRFKEIAFYICKNYAFAAIWHKVYNLLAEFKDEEVENFFVDYLVQYDNEHPDIKKIIDEYFKEKE